jgi:AraC-like DNA-binding protein
MSYRATIQSNSAKPLQEVYFMAEQLLIPVIYGRIISAAVAAAGAPMREILKGTGLGERADSILNGMTIPQYQQLLANAQRLSGDPAIALRAGLDLPFTVHGAQGVAAAASPTLQLAIETLVNFGRLRSPFARVGLRSFGDKLVLDFDMGVSMGEQARAALEFMMAVVASAINNLASIPLTYCSIEFAYPAPPDPTAYSLLLPGDMHFDADANSITLLRRELRQVLPGANPEEYKFALQRCRASYSKLFESVCVGDAIMQIFAGRSGHICTAAEVAEALHVSRRTLQRRLQAQGSSFQQLSDQWLSQQALRYLGEDQLTVDLTALLLGYSDPANFRRAFRRWFGCAPGQYRQRKEPIEVTAHSTIPGQE